MSVKDKVVIITGASSGIGKACVYQFVARGAKVVLAARSLDKMQKIAEKLPDDQYLIVPTDVSKNEDCRNLIDRSIEQFGRIDILINNAGISMRAIVHDVKLEVLKQVMDINFWGTVYCTKWALPYLLKTKGSVVGISSIAGYKGLPARSAYSASKFAMQGFLESLRIENLKTGVHVAVVCPGYTASNIRQAALDEQGEHQGKTPLDEGKLMTSEEVARHVVRAVEKRKRTIILTRLGKLTVFLSKFFPAWTDKLVFKKIAREKDSPFG